MHTRMREGKQKEFIISNPQKQRRIAVGADRQTDRPIDRPTGRLRTYARAVRGCQKALRLQAGNDILQCA